MLLILPDLFEGIFEVKINCLITKIQLTLKINLKTQYILVYQKLFTNSYKESSW